MRTASCVTQSAECADGRDAYQFTAPIITVPHEFMPGVTFNSDRDTDAHVEEPFAFVWKTLMMGVKLLRNFAVYV
jgi:hypothetical protein